MLEEIQELEEIEEETAEDGEEIEGKADILAEEPAKKTSEEKLEIPGEFEKEATISSSEPSIYSASVTSSGKNWNIYKQSIHIRTHCFSIFLFY